RAGREARAEHLDRIRDLERAPPGGALVEHVCGQARETGPAGLIPHAPGAEVQVDLDEREVVLVDEEDAEPVGERELLDGREPQRRDGAGLRAPAPVRPLLAVGRRREDGAGEDGEGQGEGGRGPRTTARAAAGTGPGRASRARTAELSDEGTGRPHGCTSSLAVAPLPDGLSIRSSPGIRRLSGTARSVRPLGTMLSTTRRSRSR